MNTTLLAKFPLHNIISSADEDSMIWQILWVMWIKSWLFWSKKKANETEIGGSHVIFFWNSNIRQKILSGSWPATICRFTSLTQKSSNTKPSCDSKGSFRRTLSECWWTDWWLTINAQKKLLSYKVLKNFVRGSLKSNWINCPVTLIHCFIFWMLFCLANRPGSEVMKRFHAQLSWILSC